MAHCLVSHDSACNVKGPPHNAVAGMAKSLHVKWLHSLHKYVAPYARHGCAAQHPPADSWPAASCKLSATYDCSEEPCQHALTPRPDHSLSLLQQADKPAMTLLEQLSLQLHLDTVKLPGCPGTCRLEVQERTALSCREAGHGFRVKA